MVNNPNKTLYELLSLEQDAREFGFDWPNIKTILDQVIDECREIQEAIKNPENDTHIQEEIGDLIHSAISLCVFAGFDVDDTLKMVNNKFAKRMQAIKTLTHEMDLPHLKGQSFDFMLELWKKAKTR
ncbi:MAG TPA: MazG nucleotide pyrophosphohydrolase domain-containing protein [Gammaproteobacteria bacterium]|jgi:uncharacterized protein YabN with tetrapyrrole methylase and pyrophosphatase domain|nr:MazG nucleotide pyrophosphohydrolase domain-containing protein [Gammaproteobacteria bacterium]